MCVGIAKKIFTTPDMYHGIQAHQDSVLNVSFPEQSLERFLGHCFRAVKPGTDVLHELGIQRLLRAFSCIYI